MNKHLSKLLILDPFIRHNLVKSGAVFTQTYFAIYCIIKGCIIDLHVNRILSGGKLKPRGANAPPLKETLLSTFHSWGKCTMPLTNTTQIGCPTLPLPVYYIGLITRLL